MRRRDFVVLSSGILIVPPLTTCASRSVVNIRSFHPNPSSAFAESCEASAFSRILFVSGQVPQQGDHVPDDYPSQYRLAWANVEKQLKAADMSFDNLVKATIFLSDRGLIAQSAGLRRAILGDRTPAITIIIAGIYDEKWLLEIEAIAVA
jgi:2-iminobutanoate/2-iminopropanoate deaminase